MKERFDPRANGFAARFDVSAGSPDALAPSAWFAGIVADLLGRQFDPVFVRSS